MTISIDNMPQLSRWMQNLTHACRAARKAGDMVLSGLDLLMLLDTNYCEHETLFRKIEPWLPEYVRVDFFHLRAARQCNRVLIVEPIVNRLRNAMLPGHEHESAEVVLERLTQAIRWPEQQPDSFGDGGEI